MDPLIHGQMHRGRTVFMTMITSSARMALRYHKLAFASVLQAVLLTNVTFQMRHGLRGLVLIVAPIGASPANAKHTPRKPNPIQDTVLIAPDLKLIIGDTSEQRWYHE